MDRGQNHQQFGHLPLCSTAAANVENCAVFDGWMGPWPFTAHYQDDHQQRKKLYRRQNQNRLQEEMQYYKASDRRKIYPLSASSLKDQREPSIALGMHRKTMLRQSMSEQNLAKFSRNSICQQQTNFTSPAIANGGEERCPSCANSNGKVSVVPNGNGSSVPHGSILSSVSSSSTMVPPNSNNQSNGEPTQQRHNGTAAGRTVQSPRHSLKNGPTSNGAAHQQSYPQSLVHLHRL